jgi:hypothetical protein
LDFDNHFRHDSDLDPLVMRDESPNLIGSVGSVMRDVIKRSKWYSIEE